MFNKKQILVSLTIIGLSVSFGFKLDAETKRNFTPNDPLKIKDKFKTSIIPISPKYIPTFKNNPGASVLVPNFIPIIPVPPPVPLVSICENLNPCPGGQIVLQDGVKEEFIVTNEGPEFQNCNVNIISLGFKPKKIITGLGHDVISIQGSANHIIHTGPCNDTVTTNGGSDNINVGTGQDTIYSRDNAVDLLYHDNTDADLIIRDAIDLDNP